MKDDIQIWNLAANGQFSLALAYLALLDLSSSNAHGYWDMMVSRSLKSSSMQFMLVWQPLILLLKLGRAFRRNSLSATAGGVFCSQNGVWLGGFSVKLGHCNAFRAELWGIYTVQILHVYGEANAFADHMANLAFDQIDRFIWYDGPPSNASLLLKPLQYPRRAGAY
ncbi:unnamed protein product [Fraxinus pennsylvanica]|uniref:RNase H type-1 domain-containing protein n=1 Tax=Fraxinus pennsylvanica TaxID=56036 RepID=A0AAD1YW48_9LAMI|nr:unnamed protein product [Fraxinus pennsylvanica]